MFWGVGLKILFERDNIKLDDLEEDRKWVC
jgi:hypothetical protein